jgi:hypothetical protein
MGRLLSRKSHTSSGCRRCVLFALLRTFRCAQRSMDDVVGRFGHRAIAIGGVEAGVVQRRKAGESPFTNDSDRVLLLLQRSSSSRPCKVVGEVEMLQVPEGRCGSPVSAAGKRS